MHLQLCVIFVTLFEIVITEKCVTPNNEVAECVPIHSCKILIDAHKTKQSKTIEFVRQSKCEGRGSDRMVCCGSTSNFLTPMINNNSEKDKLLPDREYCGYQHSDDYFRNETVVGINEFPWLAGLLYKFGNETKIRCSGTLISNRYVLTNALCILLKIELVGVRLGEYNIKTGEDCTEDSSFYECSDLPQNIDIEKKIIHPQFDAVKRVHDIGLLRLSKRVQYSDYIRPIRLPAAGEMFAKSGDTLFTASWKGLRLFSASEKKIKIYNVLISHEVCVEASKSYEKDTSITENFFCTMENNTDTNCQADLGAPVIFSFRNQWYQEGLSGYIVTCHHSTRLVVNHKVGNYFNWIKENIEP